MNADETKLELSYANGEHNAEIEVTADADGLWLSTGNLIPWEWIESARERLQNAKRQNARSPRLSEIIAERRGEFHARPTMQPEANQGLLEILHRGKRKEILHRLKTPASNRALSRCATAGLTPLQVVNPETLLPLAARVFLTLAEWFRLAGCRIGKARAKHFARFCEARLIAQETEVENQKTLQYELNGR